MKAFAALVLSAVVAIGVAVAAHPMTYKGTVVSADAKKLVATVTDEMTKKESTMTFAITTATKIYRGDKKITFADAHIVKDERVAVTIDADEKGNKAEEIRLAAAK